MEKDNKTIKKLPCTRSYARVRPSCLDPSALSTMKEGKKKEKKKKLSSVGLVRESSGQWLKSTATAGPLPATHTMKKKKTQTSSGA